VDFEKRIAAIYQQCRKADEIKSAFDALQLELDFEISETLARARQQLLENFDDEVREKLRVRDEASKASLGRYERLLMDLTRYELGDVATFDGDSAFELKRCPFPGDIPPGRYELPRRSGEAHLYRLTHPLAEAVVSRARGRPLPDGAAVAFDLSGYPGKVSVLEPFRGRRGLLAAAQLTVESLDQAEDHLLLVAVTDDGEAMDAEVARRILSLPARGAGGGQMPLPGPKDAAVIATLGRLTDERAAAIRRGISARNAAIFEAEADKLDGWADDLKLGLEREIKDLDRQIKEARRAATVAASLEEKLAAQKTMKALEGTRNQKRRSLFDAQDAIDAKRGELIARIEAKLAQTVTSEPSSRLPGRWRDVPKAEAGTDVDWQGAAAEAGAAHPAGGSGEELPRAAPRDRPRHLRQPPDLRRQPAGAEGAGAGVHRQGEVHLHRPAVQHRKRVRALRRWARALDLAVDDAAELIRAGGSVWMTIDDNESHYLKVLCDEVFGRSNFVANVIWQKLHARNNSEYLSTDHPCWSLPAT
jgi:hypothetical protein